ncbi:MAG TPA: MFS transporter [Solirubrobacterales bacterium]
MSRERAGNAVAAAFLVGLGSAWNGGNVGAVARTLAEELDVSLTAIGLLSGTVFFAAIVAANLTASLVANRTGVAAALRIVCLLSAAGNVICAVSPDFLSFAAGRVLTGLGLGFALVLAPVFARNAGGVKLVGVVGASIQLGIAGALVVGSVLLDAGVDWRVGFVVSAVLGISALPFLPSRVDAEVHHKPRHLLRAELRDPDVWRLALLFVAVLGAPLVIGAWLVPYLVDSGMQAGLAGALSFLLFASSAALRFAGGGLSKRGVSPSVLGGVAPLIAAAGLALLALDQSAIAVLASMLMIGAGVALPYAAAMVEGQWLFPAEPVAPLALLLLFTNTVPVFAIPIVGSALEAGNGETAMLVIAGFVAVAGVLNLRPPTHQIQVPDPP